MKRVLAIWLPNWPLQRLVKKQPELADRPVALHTTGRHGQVVAACSAEATAQGVCPDMPLAEAQVLLGHSRKMQPYLAEHQPTIDAEALVKLARWLHRYSPHVGVADADTLLLQATHLFPLYGSEVELLQQVASGLKQLGLTATLALADNVSTSWALAHFGGLAESSEGSAATQAPRGATLPGNCHLAPAGNSLAAIATLPIAALRLPPESARLLQELGIRQVGPLLQLPRAELHARFGDTLVKRLQQAEGTVEEIFRVVSPPETFTAQWLLESPLTKKHLLETLVQRLLQELLARLATQSRGATHVVVHFPCEGHQHATCEAKLFRPSCDLQHVLSVLEMQLEHLLLPAPATAVQVLIPTWGALQLTQQQLFADAEPLADSARLGLLIDRLAGRLGAEAVVQTTLRHDAQPEFAFREKPLIGSGKLRKATSPAVPGVLDRPPRLLPRPLAIDVLATVPDGPPRRFQSGHLQHDIARYWGPERIETGWWRKQMVERDYYRVETTCGRRMWLFRRRRDSQWFLHAYFD